MALQNKSLKEVFEENFKAILSTMQIENYTQNKFIIFPTAEFENYSTFDDIYRFWVTPCFSGVKLSYDSIIEYLVKPERNLIPLWIKVYNKNNQIIYLQISQRYRKIKEIQHRNPNNPIFPFEISNANFGDYTDDEERKAAIRILFFTRNAHSDITNFIGSKITYKEVYNFFQSHFEFYRFYPPLYNHFNANQKGYSLLVVEKDFNTNTYRIFKNTNESTEIESFLNLENAIDFYLNNEMRNEIHGIKIDHY